MKPIKEFWSLVRALLPLVGVAGLMLILGLGWLVGAARANGPAPVPGSVEAVTTYVYFNQPVTDTVAVGQGETYSASPRRQGGLDISLVRDWHRVDVFVTAEVSGTATVTVTPQFSPDGLHWTDATYHVVYTNSVAELTYRTVVTVDDTTEYLRLPVAGEYLRFQLAYDLDTGGMITPLIQATLRN